MGIVVQDSYLENTARSAGPGSIDNGEPCRTVSRTVDTGGLSFGFAAFSQPSGKVSQNPGGGTFAGIAVADTGVPSLGRFRNPPGDLYGPLDTATLLIRGVIWVVAGSATTPGAQAYVTSKGAITAVATGNTKIPASFDDAKSAGAFVRLRVV
jgi:hypothetical protein